MTTITFDFAAQSTLNAEFAKAQKAHKETVQRSRDNLGKIELSTIVPAIVYGVDSGFDLQPLADVIKANKFSPITKRAIKALFPAHTLMIDVETKRARFVRIEGVSAVADQEKLNVILDCFNSGDGIHCDQFKKAFPEPDLSKDAKVAKVGSALIKRLEKDGITVQEILEYLNKA